jgi:hypothetical protein
MVALAGKIITDYLFPSLKQPLPSSAKAFYAISGIVMMIGGLVNTFLLKVISLDFFLIHSLKIIWDLMLSSG